MTERVVHVLELVEIEQHDGGRRPAVVLRQQAPQLLSQQGAVGQAGQLIVMRELAQLLLGRFAVGNVLIREGDIAHAAVGIVHRRGREPDIKHGAVLAPASHMQISDRLAPKGALKQRLGFLPAFRRHQQPLPAHDIVGAVAEHLLGAPAP
jgi:hypothetical protein